MDENQIEIIRKYAELDNTEYGETCLALINLYEHGQLVTVEFVEALEKEIEEHLNNFIENSEIITEEVTRTEKVIHLEWKEI